MKIKEGFLVRKVAEDFVAVPVNNIENNFADIIGQGAQTVCESAFLKCYKLNIQKKK